MSMDIGSVGTAYLDLQVDLGTLSGQLSAAVADTGQAGEKAGRAFSQGVNAGVDLSPATAQLGLFDQQVGKVATDAQQLGLAFHESSVIAVASADSMGSAVQETDGYVGNLGAAFRNLNAALDPAFERLESFRPSLQQFGSAATQLGSSLSVGVTLPLVALAAASIKAFSDIDSLKRGLTSVAGSADDAAAQFQDMIEVAKLPGLGLEEAVQGTIRLQAFGLSAKESKDALLAFGNAIATVGGGKSELDRVIVQLGQMAGASKVLTQDLRPIIEQVPQLAGVLKTQFGPDVLGQPEKTLEKLGISTQQFIQIMITELGKLPKVTGGIKNDLENFADAATRSFADVGSAIAPAVHVIADALTPAMQEVAKTFADLPGAAQGAVIGIGAVAAAAGPALFIVGSLAQSISALIEVMSAMRGLAAAEWFLTTASAVSVLGGALGGLALGTFIADFQTARPPVEDMEKAVRALGISVDELQDKMKNGSLTADQYATHLANVLKQSGESAGGSSKSAIERMNDAMAKSVEIIPTLDGKIQALQKSLGFQDDSYKKLSDSEKELDIQMMEHNLTLQKMNTAMQGAVTYIEPYSRGVADLVKKHQELQSAYTAALATQTELQKLQAAGADVAGELALAHDKVTKAFKALNPEIAENEKAQKASTAALKADSEERNRQDADLLKIFDEQKKNLEQVEAAQKALTKAGQDDATASKALQQAKEALSIAFNNLNQTVHQNASEQLAATAGTKSATDVQAKQTEELNKTRDAARQYVAAITEATQQQILHQIAATGSFSVLEHGVEVYHNVGAAMQQAARDGTLTWAQVQKATQGSIDTFKMVPDAITGVMTAIEVLRGAGVQKISTLADSIGSLKVAFLSVTDALNGTSAAVPQWVLNNTVAIVNGVHIVSDAAKALFANNKELADSQEKVVGAQQEINTVMVAGQAVAVASTGAVTSATNAAKDLATAAEQVAAGMTGAGAASGVAAAGIDRVATAARNAKSAIDSMVNDPGFSMQGGPNSVGSGGGFSTTIVTPFDPTKPGQATPNAGDTKDTQWVSGPDGSYTFGTNVYSQQEVDIDAASNKVKAALTDTASQWHDFAFEIQAEMLRTGKSADAIADAIIAQRTATDAATTSIQANTVAVAETMKQADKTTPTLADLTDQLWRFIDAGQGSSSAAWDLRAQIAALQTTTQVTTNAYQDATAAASSYGSAIQAVTTTTVAAAALAVSASDSMKAHLGIVTPTPTTPVSAAGPAGPKAGLALTDSSNWNQGQGGAGLTIPITVTGQTASAIGQQITNILRSIGLS